MADTATTHVAAAWLVRSGVGRDPSSQEARLAHQFLEINRGILRDFGVTATVAYDGRQVSLALTSSQQVGAVPLLSPVTGRPDLGLLVEPRFSWSGVGAMMGTMGWRMVPSVLPLPLLPRSARDIPRWILSATILVRLQALLDSLERRFEMRESDLVAPRGAVNWRRYATRHIPRAGFLQVPCRVPDLRDDSDLRAAIHHALRFQRNSLLSQKDTGIVVARLLNLCDTLLNRVAGVPPRPLPLMGCQVTQARLSRHVFRDGLQAIEWTEDQRGLAGLSDWQGLPWKMRMDAFFEAWLEALADRFTHRHGGTVRVGRRRETTYALDWHPPYVGSQRSLIPDIMIERNGITYVLDAKYKQHWQELNRTGWSGLDEAIREHHREDLLQVLAYANLPISDKVCVVLAYPCRADAWQSARAQKRTNHIAELRGGMRRIRVILTAVPMDVHAIDEIMEEWRSFLVW